MVNFKDLKQNEIRKEYTIGDETIKILNPTITIKDKMFELIKNKVKINKDEVKFEMNNENDVEIYKVLFKNLIKGITFPKSDKQFMDIILNPNPILKKINKDMEEIIMEIIIDSFGVIDTKINESQTMLQFSEVYNKLNELSGNKIEEAEEIQENPDEQTKIEED